MEIQSRINQLTRKKPVRIIIGIIVAGILTVYAYKCITDNVENDFSIYYKASAEALDSGDIYSVPGYIYPPFCTIFLAPLLLLGLKESAAFWFFFNIAVLWTCTVLSVYIVSGKSSGLKIGYYLLPVLIVIRPIDSNFTNGQINLILLLLMLGGIVLFTRKRDYLAGIVLACAVAIKLTPLLFFPYFIYKKAYRAALGMLIGLVLFVGLVPSAVWGPRKAYELSKQNVEHLSSFSQSNDPTGYVPGESGRAALHYLLTHSNTLPPRYEDRHYYPMYINIFNLDPDLVSLIGGCLLLILALALAWLLRSDTSDRSNPALAMEWALILLAILLVSPVSRKAHFVSLLLPFAVMIFFLEQLNDKKRIRFFVLFSLIVCFALNNLTASGLIGRHVSLYLNSYCPFIFSALISFVAIALLKIHLTNPKTRVPLP